MSAGSQRWAGRASFDWILLYFDTGKSDGEDSPAYSATISGVVLDLEALADVIEREYDRVLGWKSSLGNNL